MLKLECSEAGVEFLFERTIITVNKDNDVFTVVTDKGNLVAESVVVATGGLSIPKIGKLPGISYDIAKNLG